MSDKPAGVFVRLPLNEEQKQGMYDYVSGDTSMEDAICTIGTPVTDGKEICSGSVKWHENDREPTLETYVPNAFGRGASVKIVTLSDHQAQIAALEAEVVRLREDLDASKRKNFNAGYLIACCNIYNLHNEESIAADILREAGIPEAEVKALDLNEYDAEALAVIRGAGNDDPILKGGAA